MSREIGHSVSIQPLLHIIHERNEGSSDGRRVAEANLSDKLQQGSSVVFRQSARNPRKHLIYVLVGMTHEEKTDLDLKRKQKKTDHY